ncbi:MAG: M12 family metallopeptidase [Rhodospirillales bacterium]
MSRPDRDSYVTLNFNNVIKGSEDNFDPLTDNFQDLTPFDYASVMMYIPFAFSRNGGPVLDTIPPGMQLSNLTGYTAGDIDGVKRLYGAAPTKVTVTSNPPGLSVVVDGTTVATPQTFTWKLKSNHTLAVPHGRTNAFRRHLHLWPLERQHGGQPQHQGHRRQQHGHATKYFPFGHGLYRELRAAVGLHRRRGAERRRQHIGKPRAANLSRCQRPIP